MDDLNDFLGSQEPQVEEVVAETPVEEAPIAEAPEAAPEPASDDTDRGPPRGPDGKFAKKEAPVMVPLTALHETRDELKALKAELEKLRTPQQQQEAPKAPDIFEDPDGFTGHIAQTIEQRVLNATLNLSEEMTRTSVGDELVNQAQEWARQQFAARPDMFREFTSQRNPYGYLVKLYQREQSLSELTSDPSLVEEFRAWRQSRATPEPAPQPTPAVPETLADAQSARGSTQALQIPSFDEILKRSA